MILFLNHLSFYRTIPLDTVVNIRYIRYIRYCCDTVQIFGLILQDAKGDVKMIFNNIVKIHLNVCPPFLYQARSKLTLLTLTSNSLQNFYVQDCLKKTYSCRNVLQIFLKFIQDITKIMFWHAFRQFVVKNVATMKLHPTSAWFYSSFRPPKRREISQHTVLCSPALCQSTFQFSSSAMPNGVRGVLGPQSGPLSGSFLMHWWLRAILGELLKL